MVDEFSEPLCQSTCYQPSFVEVVGIAEDRFVFVAGIDEDRRTLCDVRPNNRLR